MMIQDSHIKRTENALGVGASVEDIRDILLKEGLSEYDIFLCYHAAMILMKDKN